MTIPSKQKISDQHEHKFRDRFRNIFSGSTPHQIQHHLQDSEPEQQHEAEQESMQHPFLQIESVDAAMHYVEADLKQSKEAFEEARQSGKLAKIRKVFTSSYNAFDQISGLANLGVDIISLAVPMASPAKAVIGAFTWLFKSFKGVSDYFDRIIQFYQRMSDVFDQVHTIGKEVLGASDRYPLVLECVTEIFSLALKICNDTSKHPIHRFRTWVKISFRGDGEEDFDDIDKACKKLRSAQLASVLRDGKVLNDRMEQMGKQLKMIQRSQEGMQQMQLKQQTDPHELEATMREIWSAYIESSERNALPPSKTSKGPSTRQGAELLELQQRLGPPDQTIFLQDVRENYRKFDTKSSDFWSESEANTVTWIVGPAGIGKTYHAFSIFDHYETRSPNSVAVFFFKERQASCGLRDALSSMIHQIAVGNPRFCRKMLEKLKALENERGEKHRPDGKYLWELLSTSIFKEDYRADHERSGILLLFDGINEAGDEDQTALIELISSVPKPSHESQSASLVPIRIVLTSRKTSDVKGTALEVKVEELCPHKMRPVLESYCQEKIETMPRLRRFNARMKNRIVSDISKHADGMLYVENMLFKLDSKGFEGTVVDQLTLMPHGLDRLYKSMLDDSLTGLSKEQIHIFQGLFTWLAYSLQPISIQECREITQLLTRKGEAFAFDDEIFRRFSGFLEVLRGSPEPDHEHSNEDEDEQGTTCYDHLPLQFQSQCSRDFFRGWDPEQPDIRSDTFKSHLLILDMSANLLCGSKTGIMLEAYAAKYWFDHFLDMDAANPEGKGLSRDDICRVVANLATVLTNTGGVSKKFERHAREVYSQICGGQGSRIPHIVAKWVARVGKRNITAELQNFRGFGKDGNPTICISYVQLEPEEERKMAKRVCGWLETMSTDTESRVMAQLAQSHGQNWLLQYTPSAAAETYKFALDALKLKGEDAFNLDDDLSQAIQDLAEHLGLTKYPGRLELAVGLVQEYFKLYEPALLQYEKSLGTLRDESNPSLGSRLNQFCCSMGLSRCHAWQRNYDLGISHAEEALIMVNGIANEVDIFDIFVNGIEEDQRPDRPWEDNMLDWGQFRREALIQCAQCHSSRNSDEDDFIVFHLISYARRTTCQNPMDGFVLNRLIEVLAKREDNEKEELFTEFSRWTPRDQTSWLQWIAKTNDDIAYRRLRAAAGSGGNAKMLLNSLESAMRPLQGTRAWVWAQFRVAMLHRSVSENHQKAKRILDMLIGGRYRHQSDGILHNARFVLSDILYDEFRKLSPRESKARTQVIDDLQELPELDQRHLNHGLKNSISFINLARMHRICGNLEQYEQRQQETFNCCISALKDDSGRNDLTSLRLLAKVLSCFEELEEDARIAISLQFSHVDPEVPGKFERETDAFGDMLKEDIFDYAWIDCSCGKTFGHWGNNGVVTPLYACLICADNDLCQECFDIRRKSEKNSRFNEWEYYCPRDHKYLKGPMDGWQGVQDGFIRVKSWGEPKRFKEWLHDLEEKWENAWTNFCSDGAFIRDIL